MEPKSDGSSIGTGKSALAQNVAQNDGEYRGRFQLVDHKTRAPIANHPYRVTSADGNTDWLSSHQALSLSFQQPGSSS
ncbi:hypothetical protein [Burkholderia metallica]